MTAVCSAVLSLSILLCGFAAGAEEAVTISAECDISDVAVPIDNTVTDAAIGQTLDIKAKSAMLMEPYTGEILYEMNADEALAPASITKIMSLLLVMEAIDRGDMKLDDVITASEHAAGMGGSQIWLEPGESMTVDDLLKAAVVASANDATVALAEAIAGSEEGFVAMMNAKAEKLGMTKTHFVNCTGLDAEGHLTSAHDVAIMSSELIKHELIKNYSTIWMDTLRDGKNELVNTNKLVRFYNGTTGLKTGTTSSAGYCLAATARRNSMELVAVIMSGDTTADRFNGAKKLLDYGFSNYIFDIINPELEKDLSVPVTDGTEKSVAVKQGECLKLLLKKSDSGEISQQLKLKESVTAPIKKGDAVGSVEISVKGEPVGEVELVAAHSIDKLTLGRAFRWMLSGLLKA